MILIAAKRSSILPLIKTYDYRMKYIKTNSLLLIVILVTFQNFTVMAAEKTETQSYRVVRTEPEFEIRLYPPAILATVTSSAKSYKDLANPGFRKLASYIFGGNQSNQSIAMTTPVHMDINDTISSMSFVMPSGYTKENLPKPNNSEVKVETMDQEYVAAISFGGYANDDDIKTYSAKLENALKAEAISYHGNFRFLGYNAPYQFWGRRNEIIVGISWVEK
jgi:hypothetical protein